MSVGYIVHHHNKLHVEQIMSPGIKTMDHHFFQVAVKKKVPKLGTFHVHKDGIAGRTSKPWREGRTLLTARACSQAARTHQGAHMHTQASAHTTRTAKVVLTHGW